MKHDGPCSTARSLNIRSQALMHPQYPAPRISSILIDRLHTRSAPAIFLIWKSRGPVELIPGVLLRGGEMHIPKAR